MKSYLTYEGVRSVVNVKDAWLSLSITNKVRVASDHTKFQFGRWQTGRDRIVVSTSRCGRDNPGSNPGYSNLFSHLLKRRGKWRRL